MRKRFMGIMSLALSAAMLAGCGASGTASTSKADSGASASAAETSSSETAASSSETVTESVSVSGSSASAANNSSVDASKVTKLDLSLFKGAYGDMWDDIIALFKEQYPNCEITSDVSDDVASRVRARMMTDTPPDIVMLSDATEYNYWEGAKDGMLMDLSDMFADLKTTDGYAVTDIIPESTMENGKVQGKLYFPYFGSGFGSWYYNKALFDKNGWTAPKTWDELLELAPKIKEAGIQPVIVQGTKAIGYTTWGYLYEAVAAAGGYDAYKAAFQELDPDAWDGDAMLKAVTDFQNLVKDGYTDNNCVGMEFTQCQMEFVNDRAAMIPCGSWFENEMKDSTPDGFEMTFMPVPAQDSDGNNYVCQFGYKYFVPAKAQNIEAIKAFIGVLYSKEGQKIVAKYGNMPVTNNITSDDIAEYLTPCMKTVQDGVNAGNIKMVSNDWQELYPTMRAQLQDDTTNLLLLEMTPEEFCADMKQFCQTMLDDDSVTKYN